MLGFRRFHERYYGSDSTRSTKLAAGQTPKTLIIGCSDSRVDPAIISSASPGDIFVVRNVANLVPPFESTLGFHGVSAAIEFAVVNLKVENIVVLGHRQCGGIRALMLNEESSKGSFIGPWMSIAKPAKDRVINQNKFTTEPVDDETLCKHCELESIVTSLENLRTFPFILEAIESRGLNFFGIYFDLEQGKLLEFVPETAKFQNIDL